MSAGLGAVTGAASGGLKGALVGAVGGAAGAAVKSFTGGAVTVGLSYSAENGFGASVGVGYGPATVSVGISERGGTTVDLGLKKGGFNAGLSYNSKTGSVSGNAGFTSSQSGTGFALSYNEGDGFGASISKSLDSGVNGSLSWSEKGGVGGSIGYEAPGDKNQPKNSLANQMKGAGGSLSFNQRDGVSASVSASGGVNAGNWSQSGGFQANTNFLADQWKADFQTKQGEIEALQSQGLSKEQATAILDARAQEESKAAQNKNNQETGKSVLDGAAISTQRREDGETLSMKPLSHENVGDGAAYGGTSDGEPTGGGKRSLSSVDVAAFKESWKTESPAQTDASIASLKASGYDTSGIEKFVTDYRNSKAANNSQSTTSTTQTTQPHSTNQGPGILTNAYNAVVGGAKDLWNKAFGGGPVKIVGGSTELEFRPRSPGYTDARGNYFEQFGGTVKITDLNNAANPSYWNDKTFRQHHGGENYKADISARGGAYGPGVDFKVIRAGLEEGFGGVVVVAPNGNAANAIKIAHFTTINRQIYDAARSGSMISAGTILGFADQKIGYSDGPHFHVVKENRPGRSTNEQNLNLLRNGNAE
ncbi:hypothetical protein QMM87_18225 [Leptospira santarosai]|uniref:hypothetical protein n=1 Tax=Leptospira santarosai TaxID=28183 RepID=UPI0024AEA16B|nr:hypothetical protein [Leptospira santarosai]MDI7230559.1 hypothetical protein [Leptospira santarosai]